jgi:beta-lactamase class A
MENALPVIAGLQHDVERVVSDLPGRMGVYIAFPHVDGEVSVSADDLFPAASVIKIAVMVEVFRQVQEGRMTLDDALPVLEEELSAGSGVLQFLHVGLELTVMDAVELMIGVSDNTATNLLLRRLGGREAVNRAMEQLGLTRTRSGGAIGRPNPPRDWREWSRTTPYEMARLLRGIAERTLVSEEASETMLQALEHQVFEEMLPRYLPLNEDRSEIGEPRVQVAHKTGGLDHVRNDAGIITVRTPDGVRQAIVSVFTADLDDGNLWTVENIGVLAVAEVGRMAFDALMRLPG